MRSGAEKIPSVLPRLVSPILKRPVNKRSPGVRPRRLPRKPQNELDVVADEGVSRWATLPPLKPSISDHSNSGSTHMTKPKPGSTETVTRTTFTNLKSTAYVGNALIDTGGDLIPRQASRAPIGARQLCRSELDRTAPHLNPQPRTDYGDALAGRFLPPAFHRLCYRPPASTRLER